MPLRLHLKAGEKLILNGAVIQVTNTPANILVLNEAVILTEKDVLREEDVKTLGGAFYFVIQLMYIDPENLEIYRQRFIDFITEHDRELTESGVEISEIKDLVNQGEYYKALKRCRATFPDCLRG